MGVKHVYECDRCKTEETSDIEFNTHWLELDYVAHIGKGQSLICPTCRFEFFKFLDGVSLVETEIDLTEEIDPDA